MSQEARLIKQRGEMIWQSQGKVWLDDFWQMLKITGMRQAQWAMLLPVVTGLPGGWTLFVSL